MPLKMPTVEQAQPCPLVHDQQHRDESELMVVADAVGDADEADDSGWSRRTGPVAAIMAPGL
jgi:hypothetical protein